MSEDPHYTDRLVTTPRRAVRYVTPDRMESRLRMCNTDYPQDLMWDAADLIRDLTRELAEARGQAAAEHAALVTMTADRDRLAAKVQKVAELLEPRTWADNSRNHTLLAGVIYDGVPEPRKEAA